VYYRKLLDKAWSEVAYSIGPNTIVSGLQAGFTCQDTLPEVATMSEEEKGQTVHEEDDHGNILVYPVWNKKNAPKDNQDKWEVPIYL
jgi:hypothetical protein